MKTRIIPAAFAVLAVSSFAAFAAPTMTTGVIKSMDAKTQTVTLADGSVYVLPKGFNAKTLKVGEKVAVAWTLSAGKNVAETIKAAK
ncbi:MAG: DUF1344 domain-containing protein [Pseudomonadota bacterium]